MEFDILGPLRVATQGRALEIGAGKQRALLAVLLLHANEVVSTDRLIDDLWGERPPATAPKIVQGYVSRLRKVLAGETRAGDAVGGGESILLTRPPGYVLQLDRGQLDADCFTALLAKGRAALAAGDPHDASTLLREALALWRGPPLADFAFDSFAHDEIARLEELRLAAIEERIEADLTIGQHGNLVAELEALVARHPLRERLGGQLMTALYRCGRQAEALHVYQETRRLLVEELGLEPSRRLQELEQRILRQDASLDLVPGHPAVRRAEPGRADQLGRERRPGGIFVGRERELAVLTSALEGAPHGSRTARAHRRGARDREESSCRGAGKQGDGRERGGALGSLPRGRRCSSVLALGAGASLLRSRPQSGAASLGAWIGGRRDRRPRSRPAPALT